MIFLQKTRTAAWALVALLSATSLAGCADGPVYSSVKTTAYSAGVSGYLRGTMAELNGDDARATRDYLNSLTEDPDNVKLRLRSFNLALLSNDVPTAVRLARTLPAPMAAQTMPQLVLGLADIQEGKLAAAQEIFGRMAKANPAVLQFQVVMAHLQLAQGMPAPQVVAKLTALKLPAALEGRRWYQVAQVWLRAGETAKAMAALTEANRREPNAVFTTLALGNLTERNGQPDQAQQLYATFRQANPTNGLFAGAGARIARGELPPALVVTLPDEVAATVLDFSLLLWAQGAPLAARQLVNAALWLQAPANLAAERALGGDPWLLYYGGIIEEFGGDLRLARARFTRAGQDPDLHAAAGLRLAELSYHDGHVARARKALQALLTQYPDEPALWQGLAEMAQEQADYPAALTAYTKLEGLTALTATPAKKVAILYARGAMLERLHRTAEAEEALKMALQIDPANAQVLNYLAYMWVDRGEHLAEAQAMLEKAVALAPTDGAIVDSLGWMYFKIKDFPKARVLLERAVELTPDDATVADHLAELYDKIGQKQEAQRQWQRALEVIKPDEGELKQQIEARLGRG